MRVLYDFQILYLQKYGGISRYFYELFTRLKQKNIEVELDCIRSQNYYFKDVLNKSVVTTNNKIARKVYKIINQWSTIRKAKNNYDIIHPTYYSNYIVGKYKGKLVLTVYDMICELYPDMFPESARSDKKVMLHEADHLIAISESTKRDVLKIYPEIPANKITVIYIGTNMKKSERQDLRERFPGQYILFVGQRSAYKNFAKFWKAVMPILQENENLHLVCTGGGAFTEDEIRSFGNCKSRVHQINCDDELLAAAYTNAECFVFPSLYEGFGIPTLEAFSCDCPAIISDSSSMPEVGGDAVLYFNPESVDEMTGQIRKVLNDDNLKQDLIIKGRQQLKKFDWDQIAQQTLDCYKKVLNND